MTNILYALHDSDTGLKKYGAFPIWSWQAKEYNEKGYGIFHTPNLFYGRRIKSDLQKIRYWIADLDDGSKEEQMRLIKKCLLKPSLIIETNKGYHCYWEAINATFENYTEIEKGLIHKLNADKGCKDVTRLLRYPNYLHQKNPQEPFKINIIEKNKNKYTEKEMLYYFKIPKEKVNYRPILKGTDKDEFLKPENWDRLFGLNQIGKGNRNNELTRIAFWLKDEGFAGSELEGLMRAINSKLSNPIDNQELNSLIKGKK